MKANKTGDDEFMEKKYLYFKILVNYPQQVFDINITSLQSFLQHFQDSCNQKASNLTINKLIFSNDKTGLKSLIVFNHLFNK